MDRFVWRQAPQLSPLFQFAVRGSLRVIFQCVAVIIRFLRTTFKNVWKVINVTTTCFGPFYSAIFRECCFKTV
jgi:hypothetical protein